MPDTLDLDTLRTKHGEIWTLQRGAHRFVLRCPESAEFRRYTITVAEDRAKVWDAQEVLVKHGVVFPAAGELDAVLEKRPMLIPTIANQLAAIAAEEDRLDAKKV